MHHLHSPSILLFPHLSTLTPSAPPRVFSVSTSLLWTLFLLSLLDLRSVRFVFPLSSVSLDPRCDLKACAAERDWFPLAHLSCCSLDKYFGPGKESKGTIGSRMLPEQSMTYKHGARSRRSVERTTRRVWNRRNAIRHQVPHPDRYIHKGREAVQ